MQKQKEIKQGDVRSVDKALSTEFDKLKKEELTKFITVKTRGQELGCCICGCYEDDYEWTETEMEVPADFNPSDSDWDEDAEVYYGTVDDVKSILEG
jgi:hypothetical protein